MYKIDFVIVTFVVISLIIFFCVSSIKIERHKPSATEKCIEVGGTIFKGPTYNVCVKKNVIIDVK